MGSELSWMAIEKASQNLVPLVASIAYLESVEQGMVAPIDPMLEGRIPVSQPADDLANKAHADATKRANLLLQQFGKNLDQAAWDLRQSIRNALDIAQDDAREQHGERVSAGRLLEQLGEDTKQDMHTYLTLSTLASLVHMAHGDALRFQRSLQEGLDEHRPDRRFLRSVETPFKKAFREACNHLDELTDRHTWSTQTQRHTMMGGGLVAGLLGGTTAGAFFVPGFDPTLGFWALIGALGIGGGAFGIAAAEQLDKLMESQRPATIRRHAAGGLDEVKDTLKGLDEDARKLVAKPSHTAQMIIGVMVDHAAWRKRQDGRGGGMEQA